MFLGIALYKHTILFSTANQKRLEQWIESSTRMYLHDHHVKQREATAQWLLKNRSAAWKSIEAVFSFESIIQEADTTDVRTRQENEIIAAWERLYADLKQYGGVAAAPQSPPR